MNWIMVLGIAFIAIGTFLTYLGSNYQSNKISKEIIDKLQITNDKIEALQKNPGENREAITNIDDEFKSWASDFIKNRDSYKLKLEKENIDAKSNAITISQEWYPFYNYFITALTEMINAYNESSPTKIITKIPPMPANLYSDEAKKYIAKIKFSNNVIWIIQLQDFLKVNNTSLPSIEIDIEKIDLFDKDIIPNQDFIHTGDLTIQPNTNNSKIYIRHFEKFNTKELLAEYDLNDYKNSIKKILEIIIRYQLLNI